MQDVKIKRDDLKIDGHKMMYHVKEVSKWLRGEIVAPIYIEVSPATLCNHKCKFCALTYTRDKGVVIDESVLVDCLKDMASFGVKSIMFAGEGEPLIYPALPEVIEKAKGFGLDIAITTNGVLLNEEKAKRILKHLSWIKFSIDAGNERTYARIHGCKKEDFTNLLKNIKFACDYKKENKLECRIGCQMVLIEDNISEVEELASRVKDLGADYLVLKPFSTYLQHEENFTLDFRKYEPAIMALSNRYLEEGFRLIYRDLSFREIEKTRIDCEKCYGINFFAIIDAAGNVVPCNLFYKRKAYFCGNIYENSFRDIWRSKKRRKIAEEVCDKDRSECRKACRLNFVNKYLNGIKNKNVEHINFI